MKPVSAATVPAPSSRTTRYVGPRDPHHRNLRLSAASLEYAADLAAEATACAQPHARMAGALITAAVNSLTELLDREFLGFGGDTASIVQAYAADHRHITKT